jgi:hypothetical protein
MGLMGGKFLEGASRQPELVPMLQGKMFLLVGLTTKGLTNATTHALNDWTEPTVGGFILIGAIGTLLFILAEARAKEPIVPLSLFKNRAFTVSVIVGAMSGFGMFGALIFVPLIFQGVLGVTATNSGTLITPMMFGLIGASVVSGQLMVRIRQYKWLGTFGAAVMAVGVYILSLVTIHSTQFEVTSALVIVGAGLGLTFPLYLNAVQSAVDKRFLGVVSANLQFFRNMGGTIATAVLGSVLANRLGPNIQDQINRLNLPPAFKSSFKLPNGVGGAQQLFNAANLAHQRALLPEAARPLFDQVIVAVKVGLASTMHEVFLIALVAVLITLVATVFMPSVPLLAARRQPGAELGAESPVPEPEAVTA